MKTLFFCMVKTLVAMGAVEILNNVFETNVSLDLVTVTIFFLVVAVLERLERIERWTGDNS